MKNTTNVFLKGMTSDMHPLTTSQQEYTDALNATLITFNGNEQMMQNDMGNTLIQDSKTGNIMGLREGFVPVGLKEHGGIMYIASVNKDGVGEIGTIPSPVIRYNKQKDYLNTLDIKWSATPSSPSNLYKITKEKLYTGDKFATILQLKDDAIITVDYIDFSGNNLNLYYPEYSYSTSKEEQHASNKGLYSVNLLSQTDDQIFDMSDQIQPKSELFTYKIESDLDSNLNKKYWFVNLPNNYDATQISFDIDNMLALNTADSNDKQSPFITYPNIPAGYPSVQFKTENINSFELSTNDTTGHVHPLTKAVVDSETKMQYYAIFPYFVYSTDSAVHVDEIEVCVIDNEGKKCPLQENLGDNFWSDSQSDLTFKISEIGPKRYQRIKNNISDFAIALNELNSITTKTDSSFNTDDSNALFRMKIGEDLNKWYTLYVKYKSNEWENEILGEYNLKFNQFIMDIEGEFIDTRIENQTTNQIYDKSKEVDDPINFKKLYKDSNSDTLNVLYTFRSSNDFLDINIDYGEFIPHTANDVKLKYLYTLSDAKVENWHVYENLQRWSIPTPEITIECRQSGADSTAKFWAVLNDFYERVNRGDSTIANHSYTIGVTFDVYTYSQIGEDSYPIKNPDKFQGSVSATLNSSDMKVYYAAYGAAKSLSISGGNFSIILDGRKILEQVLNLNSQQEANVSFSNSRLCINNIYLLTTESNPQPYPGRHQYSLYWRLRQQDSYGEWYSNKLTDLVCVTDGDDYNAKRGGTGEVYNISDPIQKKEIGVNYDVNVMYTPHTGDPYEVSNQGDYEVTYQCNLEGKDRNSTAGNYIKYGMTTTTLADSDHRMHLCPCLMNTNENKLSSIIDSSDVFEQINVKNYTSSFIQNIPIKKLKNDTITFNESDSVTINQGLYYLGSVIRNFHYTTNRDGSINIESEVTDDAPIETAHNYISLTVIPQTFDGSDGTPIEIRVASSNIDYPTTDDYYEKKSGREGGILYLPYGGSITKISAVRESNDQLLLVQDIGLYEVNLREFDIETPLYQKVINANNVAFYEPNRYFDNSFETHYGYYYISPQICWVFNENGIECAQKEFATLHFGLHAYQTNFKEYYYDRTTDSDFVILNIPNGDRIPVNFRKYNNDSD